MKVAAASGLAITVAIEAVMAAADWPEPLLSVRISVVITTEAALTVTVTSSRRTRACTAVTFSMLPITVGVKVDRSAATVTWMETTSTISAPGGPAGLAAGGGLKK